MSTPRTRVKMATLAPMPSASVMITTNVNPGDLRSCRRAKRTSFNMEVIRLSVSFCSQRDNWVDTRRTASWHAAGDQSHEHQRQYSCDYSADIDGADVVKQRHQRAAGSNRTDQTNSDADCNQCHALAEHELENVCAFRAERHANAEFPSALRDRERHHAVKPNARKHERKNGKRA